MADQTANRRVVERLWRALDAFDFAGVGQFLHENVVCQWPLTRERIRGRANYVAVNTNYPGRWRHTIERLVASGDQVVTDVRAVSFFEVRDGLISRASEYWVLPYDPPLGRGQWVERIDD